MRRKRWIVPWLLFVLTVVGVYYVFFHDKRERVELSLQNLPKVAGISTSKISKDVQTWAASGSAVFDAIRPTKIIHEATTSTQPLINTYFQNLRMSTESKLEDVRNLLILKGLEKLGVDTTKLGKDANSVSESCPKIP